MIVRDVQGPLDSTNPAGGSFNPIGVRTLPPYVIPSRFVVDRYPRVSNHIQGSRVVSSVWSLYLRAELANCCADAVFCLECSVQGWAARSVTF